MRMCSALRVFGGVIGALALLGLGSPAAASTFEVCIDGGVPCVFEPSPASGSWPDNNGISTASASSVGGVVEGSASATATGTGGAYVTRSASFEARAIIDDVVISGPSGDVSTQISADLDGLVNLVGGSANDASATVEARLKIFHTGSGSTAVFSTNLNLDSAGADRMIDTLLTTPAVTLPTNTNLTVELTVYARFIAGDTIFLPGSANASVDDLTLSLPTIGPALILPAGFTANSADGNIVDNQFVGPPAVPALGGPAVAMLALLLTAFGTRRLTRNERP
jgi:hypothetical protein